MSVYSVDGVNVYATWLIFLGSWTLDREHPVSKINGKSADLFERHNRSDKI